MAVLSFSDLYPLFQTRQGRHVRVAQLLTLGLPMNSWKWGQDTSRLEVGALQQPKYMYSSVSGAGSLKGQDSPWGWWVKQKHR